MKRKWAISLLLIRRDMQMRILFYRFSFYLVLIASIGMLAGCATAPPQIAKPTPNFSWEPPSKENPQNLTIALVRPFFGSDARFMSYSKNPYLKTFLDSILTDLQRTLMAKGFNVTGPFESFDVMTFPNKKDAALALMPEFVLVIDEKYTDSFRNESGSYFRMKGSIIMNGFIKFTMIEPISEQKIWIKKINVPEQTGYLEVDLMYTDLQKGVLNPFNANKDNREATLVDMLNRIYPESMEKFWSYLNTEEIEMMRKASLDARARKGY